MDIEKFIKNKEVIKQQTAQIFYEESAPAMVNKYYNSNKVKFAEKCLESGFLSGAEYADRCFKVYLEKKLEVEKARNHGIESCTMRLLMSIINELFKED